MPNLEVEDYVLLGRHTEELSSGDSLSESSEDGSEEGRGGEASMSVTLEFGGYSQAHILLEGYCSSFGNRHLS